MGWRLTFSCTIALACAAGCKCEPLQSSQEAEVESTAGVTKAPKVDRDSFVRDLRFIAKPRPSGSAHSLRVREYCAAALTKAGYDVQRKAYGSGTNVVGVKRGRKAPKEWVMIGAHYDSVPDCAGADDNASGVAGVLSAARALSAGSHDRTLAVACFDEEETGLKGSSAFAAEFVESSNQLLVYLNFEMIGYASSAPNSQQIPRALEFAFGQQSRAVKRNALRGDFIAVVTDARARSVARVFAQEAERLALPHQVLPVNPKLFQLPGLGDLLRSDHTAFWLHDLPAIMLTDTAELRNPGYHCIRAEDSLKSLNLPFAVRVTQATVATALHLLNG